MAVSQFPDARRATRRFYLLVAILFPLIVLAGFARTYYLKEIFGTPPLSSLLVHLHGLLMTTWVALFIAQVWFISSKRIRLHQRLGYLGVALAVTIIPVGVLTAINAAKYGSASAPPDIPPLSFLVVPVFDMVVFAILFGAAVYYRKRPANHKRLMLLTVLNFLPPAIARIPLAFVAAAGPLVFFGVPDILAIVFIVTDTWLERKINKVFLAGTILLIASHPLRLILGGTGTWMSFAEWLTR